MPDSPYIDATPDANITADFNKADLEETEIAEENDQAPTPEPYKGAPSFNDPPNPSAQDIMRDLILQEQQKQLDLVRNVYGAGGPASDLTQADQRLQDAGTPPAINPDASANGQNQY